MAAEELKPSGERQTVDELLRPHEPWVVIPELTYDTDAMPPSQPALAPAEVAPGIDRYRHLAYILIDPITKEYFRCTFSGETSTSPLNRAWFERTYPDAQLVSDKVIEIPSSKNAQRSRTQEKLLGLIPIDDVLLPGANGQEPNGIGSALVENARMALAEDRNAALGYLSRKLRTYLHTVAIWDKHNDGPFPDRPVPKSHRAGWDAARRLAIEAHVTARFRSGPETVHTVLVQSGSIRYCVAMLAIEYGIDDAETLADVMLQTITPQHPKA